MPDKTIQQLTDDIKRRIDADPAFLHKLIVDPQAAGAEVYGGPLPERTVIRLAFHGTTLPPNTTNEQRITLWLPHPDSQLSEEELEAVTGGAAATTSGGGTTNDHCGNANAICPK